MKRVNIKCQYCGSRAFLRPATVVRGKNSEPGEEVYICARYPKCDAYVGAHRHNHMPMGTLANRELRRKRIAAHAAFNRLWQRGLMTKRAAYRWLQVQLGLPPEEAHSPTSPNGGATKSSGCAAAFRPHTAKRHN